MIMTEQVRLVGDINVLLIVQMDSTTLESHARWADGYVFMYSVMDAASFQHVTELLRKLCTSKTEEGSTPAIVVANKVDLTHARVVSEVDGCETAHRHHCSFYEVGADVPC